jgi:hypothetical protein
MGASYQTSVHLAVRFPMGRFFNDASSSTKWGRKVINFASKELSSAQWKYCTIRNKLNSHINMPI